MDQVMGAPKHEDETNGHLGGYGFVNGAVEEYSCRKNAMTVSY
jgi:hypothetical protein